MLFPGELLGTWHPSGRAKAHTLTGAKQAPGGLGREGAERGQHDVSLTLQQLKALAPPVLVASSTCQTGV